MPSWFEVRGRVAPWRKGGHIGVTKTTAQLLAYWTRPDRERPLFFCQIEALETVIYLTEIAPKLGLRLSRLIEGGNSYVAAIASLSDGSVRVIIREIYQHPSQQGRPSFPAAGGDNFLVLREGTDRLGGEVDTDAFEKYFAAFSPVAPGPQNRITQVP